MKTIVIMDRLNGFMRRNARWADVVLEKVNKHYGDKRELERLAIFLEEMEDARSVHWSRARPTESR